MTIGQNARALVAAALVVAALLALEASLGRRLNLAPFHIAVAGACALAAGLLLARQRLLQSDQATLEARLQTLLDREAVLARTDALTGILNSRALHEVLGVELERSQLAPRSVCLAYLDLDNFKKVNDAVGREAGDEVLRRIATALRQIVRAGDGSRAGDVAARMGGDEFAVLFWGLSEEVVEKVVGRLLTRLVEIAREHPDAHLGASIGVAYFAQPPQSADEVIRRADAAMYEAKALGKGRVVVSRGEAGGFAAP